MDKEHVQTVLDQIRPALQADGGDVELIDVTDDGVSRSRFRGVPRMSDVAADVGQRRRARPQGADSRDCARRARLVSGGSQNMRTPPGDLRAAFFVLCGRSPAHRSSNGRIAGVSDVTAARRRSASAYRVRVDAQHVRTYDDSAPICCA